MNGATHLISAGALAELIDNPGMVIVDCRFSLADPQEGARQYKAAHIPGAHYTGLEPDLAAPVERHGGRHPLPQPSAFQSLMRQIGVCDNTPVIAYDASGGAFAARLWWLLRYFGHSDVRVLDGGFQAWHSAGFAVNEAQPVSVPGNFSARPEPGQIVAYEQVKSFSAAGDALLIDSREEKRYLGLEEPIDPVAGHIPGAINKPWQQVLGAEGLFLPQSEQQARWKLIDNPENAVVYCGSGVTACVNLLSMALAGIEGAKLYPGSWSDWCSHL